MQYLSSADYAFAPYLGLGSTLCSSFLSFFSLLSPIFLFRENEEERCSYTFPSFTPSVVTI